MRNSALYLRWDPEINFQLGFGNQGIWISWLWEAFPPHWGPGPFFLCLLGYANWLQQGCEEGDSKRSERIWSVKKFHFASLKTLVLTLNLGTGWKSHFKWNWKGARPGIFHPAFSEVRFREFLMRIRIFNVWLGLEGKVNSHPPSAAFEGFPLPKLTSKMKNSKSWIARLIMPLTVSYDQLNQLLAEKSSEFKSIFSG